MENLVSIFKDLVLIFEGKLKMYHELLFLQNLFCIDVLLNLKDIFSVLVRVRKKDLYIVSTRNSKSKVTQLL